MRASSCSASSTSRGSRPPISASAPAQNTFPTTAASCNRLLRSGLKRVQAGGDQRLHRLRHLHALRRAAPGLRAGARTPPHTTGCRPPAPSNARCVSAGSTACSNSDAISRAVSSSESGARLIVVAFRRPAAQAGCRSYSSGRAVHSTSSGTPSDQSARCSRNASSAASAQCRSSNTNTAGPSAANPSRNRRQAVNNSSCAAGSPPAPTSGDSRARSQGRSGSASGRRRAPASPPPAPASPTPGSRLRLHDLAQRPERDPLPIRQAAALPPADQPRPILDIAEQLRTQPALAHPRLAHDRDQLAGALLRRPLERPDQKRLAPTRGRPAASCAADDVRAEPGPGRTRLPQRKRLRLPLHHNRRQRLVLEHPLRRPIGLLRRPRPRPPAPPPATATAVFTTSPVTIPSPCSGRARQRHHRLTRIDPHPHLQRQTGIGLVQLRDRLQDPQPRPHRPLRIILMRHRRPEHRHHRIPDELLHRPPVPLDLLTQTGVVRAQASPHILRIRLLRRRRKADQVAEQDRHHLPLLSDPEGATLVRGAVQNPQNWKPSGFSLPQEGQAATERVYDEKPKGIATLTRAVRRRAARPRSVEGACVVAAQAVPGRGDGGSRGVAACELGSERRSGSAGRRSDRRLAGRVVVTGWLTAQVKDVGVAF